MTGTLLFIVAFLYLCAAMAEWSKGNPIWAVVYGCFAVSNLALLLIGMGAR